MKTKNHVKDLMSIFRHYRVFTIVVLCISVFSSNVWAVAHSNVKLEPLSLRGDFQNRIDPTMPTGPTQAVGATTFFSGQVCNPISAACPSSVNSTGQVIYKLGRSGFGQMITYNVPYTSYIKNSIKLVRKMLFYADALPGDPNYSPQQAALRYKVLMYETDAASGTIINKVAAGVDGAGNPFLFSDIYTQADRDRLTAAEVLIREALKYAPGNVELRQILMDIYYERAVAETILAKQTWVDSARNRLEVFNQANGESAIATNEIVDYDFIIAAYTSALDGYFGLLRDSLGVNTAAVDPSAASGMPYGYWLFRHLVPSRGLDIATYLDAGGNATPVVATTVGGSAQLYSGYKDLVLLFDLLAGLSEAITHQTRLYAMRGVRDKISGELLDAQQMLDNLKHAHEKIYLDGNILLGIFPPDLYTLPDNTDPSGFTASVGRWAKAMSQLTAARGWITGETNVLGFSPDFLMLVGQTNPINPVAGVDSYDVLYDLLTKFDGGKLSNAVADLERARGNNNQYQATLSDLQAELRASQSIYNDRLISLVGARRCNTDLSDCSGTQDPNYLTPAQNTGSAVNMQINSISVAKNRIDLSIIQLENLFSKIEIEIDRRGQVAGVEDAISQVYLNFGTKQAKLTQAIAKARVRAARAAQMAGIVSSIGTAYLTGGTSAINGVADAYSANANIQMIGDVAALEAQKELLAALERATINDLGGVINDINSQKQIETWMLDASVITLSIMETELLLTQEMARLKAITDEIASIEQRMDQDKLALSDRYFADPIHRLRMEKNVLRAQYSFEEAQIWTFFALRALKYKWNTDFILSVPGLWNWTEDSVYKVRNADELNQLITAMNNFNTNYVGVSRLPFDDIFSFREDFLGYRDVFDVASGLPATYPDPISGLPVTFDVAFRSYLRQRQQVDTATGDTKVVLNFSTVRQKAGSGFFRLDTYLDKINFIEITIPGNYQQLVNNGNLIGKLTYGGISFMRTPSPGIVDINAPNRIRNELTPWSVRNWYFSSVRNQWESQEASTVPVSMLLSNLSNGVPSTVPQSRAFSERSVATTDWQLEIPLNAGATILMNIDNVDDILFRINHLASARQPRL